MSFMLNTGNILTISVVHGCSFAWKTSSCTLTYKRKRPITSVPGLSSTNNLETTLGRGIFRLEVLKAWAHIDDEAVAITNAAITFAFSIGVFAAWMAVGHVLDPPILLELNPPHFYRLIWTPWTRAAGPHGPWNFASYISHAEPYHIC